MMSTRRNVEAVYPLSPMQQGMLFHTLFASESGIYVEQIWCVLRGCLRFEEFKRAWQRVVDRHSILRTAFLWDKVNEPLQVVGARVKVSIEVQDWTSLTKAQQSGRLEAFLDQDKRRGFKLSKAPLLRLALIRLSDDSHYFVWSHHHLLLDGWSLSLVLREVFLFYEAFCRQSDVELPESPPFRDYVAWLQQQSKPAAEAFWREKLAGISEATTLRIDQSTVDRSDAEGKYEERQVLLDEETTQSLQISIRSHQLTLNTLIQAAWALLLGVYSGREDVLYGTVVSGRPPQLPGVETMTGLFINTLPVRVRLLESEAAATWLKQLQASLSRLREFEYSALVDIQRWSELPRGVNLFDSLLLFENYPIDAALNEGSASIAVLDVHFSDKANYPLSVFVVPDRRLSIRIAFDSGRFEGLAVERMLEHFRILIEALPARIDSRIGDLSLLTPAETRQLIFEWNKTDFAISDGRIDELVAAQADRAPDLVAISQGQVKLTYGEMDRRANLLAGHLLSFGVRPESRVAVCLERSPEMIVGLLGILKSGAAYVPMDPSYPLERLATILEDAEVALLVTRENLLQELPSIYATAVCLDADWPEVERATCKMHASLATGDNAAYVIYTSGSTGRPKGVVVTHRNLVNATVARTGYYRNPVVSFLLLSSFAFDSSMAGIFWTLTTGGLLTLPNAVLDYDPGGLAALVVDERVSHLLTIPSFYAELLARLKDEARGLATTVIVAGEACPSGLVERHRAGKNHSSLFNEYGPTECCVWSTAFDCSASTARVPIGKPIANTRVFLVGRGVVPVGIPGEVYIGGAGLARGYLRGPDATAAKFVPDALSGRLGSRLYKTGDVARHRSDGNVEFLGRMDFQVKVRGHRIELQEIESLLQQHPGVRDAVVAAREDDSNANRLVAYLVLEAESSATATSLQQALRKQCPEYMVPSLFVMLDKMPLKANGKVDRAALPAPDKRRPELGEGFVPPQTGVERTLAEIWADVLSVDRVGIDDNFFELGGDSILSVKVLSKSQDRGLHLTLQQLFERKTIRALATVVEQVEAPVSSPAMIGRFALISERDRVRLPATLEDAYPLTALQMGLIFHSELRPDTAIYQSIHSFHLKGQFEAGVLRRAVERVAERHPVLRTSYALTGYDEPLQLVHRDVEAPIEIEELRHLPLGEQRQLIGDWLQAEKLRHFNYNQPPLFRFHVHRLSEETFQLTFTAHHSLLDGWSDGVFFTELFKEYISGLQGRVPEACDRPLTSFREFVELERQALRSKECRDYWRQSLAGAQLEKLPRWPYSRELVDNTKFREFNVRISDDLSGGLKRLAQVTSVPLKSVLLAAHLRVVSLINGQRDVITGLVSNGRPETTDSERMIGLFVNTLPFRQRLEPGSWISLIQRTFEAERELLPYRRYPLAEIQKEYAGQLLFEPCFNFTHFHVYQSIQGMEGLDLLESTSVGETNFVLLANFYVDVPTSKAGLKIGCNAAELAAEQLRAIGGYYLNALEEMVSDPEGNHESTSLIPEAELRQILFDWNRTESHYPHEFSLHALFEDQVERAPARPAVISESEELSFRDLNGKANRLAHRLRRLGVGPDVPVALYLERSVEAIVGILAILKAGGAYVPLSPAYPEQRLAFALADAGARVIVTEENLLSSLPDLAAEVVRLDVLGWESLLEESNQNPNVVIAPENLAYIIYTSGSTGKPKGVMVEHRSAVNLVTALFESIYCNYSSPLRVGVNAPLVFDASVKQVLQLLAGNTLVLMPEEIRLDGPALVTFIDSNQVDALDCTPSHLKQLLKGGLVEDGRDHPLLMLVGGEPIEETLWHPLSQSKRTRFYNVYGPTECTVDTSVCAIEPWGREPTIGRPIANVQIFILDERLHPVPIGVPGEMWVTGAGLARGYFSRPELTAKSFVPNPFGYSPGARMYKTGDAVRYLPDGRMEFLGRIDQQLKIRGYRIEPGEIEATLTEHEGVADSAVILRKDAFGEGRLVAYIVNRRHSELSANELRVFLGKRLPEYMIPSGFVTLDALPLTPNGKLDRQALPREPAQSEPVDTFLAPRTPVEEVLASIWCELFNVGQIGVKDNFFQMGGHSLLATQAVAWASDVFQLKIPLRSLFDSPSIEGIAGVIELNRKAGLRLELPAIPRVNRDRRLPLSFAQQRLWFMWALDPDIAAYNIPLVLRLTGPLNVDALRRSIEACIARHESLRTSFANEEGRPYQVVADEVDFELEVFNVRRAGYVDSEKAIRRLAMEETTRPFDLTNGPLLRIKLLKAGDDDYVLVFTMHHIIGDGWSIGVLVRDLGALYEGFSLGKPVDLEPLSIQYADYAVWQRESFQGEVLADQLNYWKGRLMGAPAALDLPADRPRPAVYHFNGAHETFEASKSSADALRLLTRREGLTIFMTLLAAFKSLLYRYTGQTDIVVGTPIAGRTRREVENLVGLFVNTLVLRTKLSGDLAFRDLLDAIREVTLGAYAHQELPLEKLVEELQPDRDVSHTPLFQTMFAFRSEMPSELELKEIAVSYMEIETGTSKFDLSLSMNDTAGRLQGVVEYNTDIFDAATVRRLLAHLLVLLDSVSEAPDARLSALPLLREAERQQIVVEWNRPESGYSGLCIHEWFEQVTARAPDRTALVSEQSQLSYRELNRSANQLARFLQMKGVRPGSVVGILMDYSLELAISVWGTLKSGAAYVPLDPNYPQNRLLFMIEDARVEVLLTDPRWANAMPEGSTRKLSVDSQWSRIAAQSGEDFASGAAPDHAAYVIYTSGSTGKPKGAVISHRCLASLMRATEVDFSITESDTVFLKGAFSFDASVWEFYTPLMFGGRLVIADPDGQFDPAYLVRAIRENEVTVAHFVPSLLDVVAHEPDIAACRSLRIIWCGGEAWSPELGRRFMSSLNSELYNTYGPTECTVNSTQHRCDNTSVRSSNPIGRPMSSTRAYVLNSSREPVPIGVRGELHLGGRGVGLGYLNRPGLTAEKFAPDPWSSCAGARMYRTGDEVRFLASGEIDFVGRLDTQVKIRGFRIELGEIESVLLNHHALEKAIVVNREDVPGDKRLVAYIVLRNGLRPGVAELREFLRKALPDYMVPSSLLVMDGLPRMPNGKVDISALPAPTASRTLLSSASTDDGASEVKRLLITIWEQVLRIEGVGVDEDFFELGGHSLLVTQLVARIRQVFRVNVTLRSVFESPRLGAMMGLIEEAMRTGVAVEIPAIARAPSQDSYPLSFAQQRLWLMDQMEPGIWLYNTPMAVRLMGVLDFGALEATINELMRRHDSLRTSFAETAEGPRQIVTEGLAIGVDIIDLCDLSVDDREETVRRIAKEEASRLFDLRRAPLVRAKLVKLREREHALLLTLHHIITDGWSMSRLIDQFGAVYRALTQHQTLPGYDGGLRYLDYSIWQREWLRDEHLEGLLGYWRRQLSGAPTMLDMPTDRPRRDTPTYQVAIETVTIPTDLANELKVLGRRESATLFMILLAAYKTLLYRWAHQEDLSVGTAIANRTNTQLEDCIGFFVNMLVLRTKLSGSITFRELLGRVREVALDGYAHQDLPFDKLVEELQPERALSHVPLFQTVFVLQNVGFQPVKLPGLTMSTMEVYSGTTPFELTFTMSDTAEGLVGLLGYQKELYEAATVTRMLHHFVNILREVAADPELKLIDIDLERAATKAVPQTSTALPELYAVEQFSF